jgi:hypothetical protein
VSILSFLSSQYNAVVADGATQRLHDVTQTLRDIAPEAHVMLTNLPFCAYGAVACALALLAWRERKTAKVLDHALHALASLILALVHLLT